MTDTPTPRTDKKQIGYTGHLPLSSVVETEFARQLERELTAAQAVIAKLHCTTSRICGAHIGAVDVKLTGNFALGCPCCQRDCAQISLQGYITAKTVEVAEIVELRKDKERLDWLQNTPTDGFIMIMENNTLFDWAVNDKQTLRSAIDAAMKPEDSKP